MSQTISHSGLALIQNFEGCKLEAYPDAGGVWTIGYGHTSGAGAPTVHAGMHITQPEAEVILSNDMEKFEAIVRKHVTATLTQHEFDALTSFVYNVGETNFAKSTLLQMVNAGNMAGAKTQFARWTRANGVVLQGLVRRRAAEASLFAAPDTPGASAQAPIKSAIGEDPAPAAAGLPSDILASLSKQIIDVVASTIGPLLAARTPPAAPPARAAPPAPPAPAADDPLAEVLGTIVTDTVGPVLAPAGPSPGGDDPSTAADESSPMTDAKAPADIALSTVSDFFKGVVGKLETAHTMTTSGSSIATGVVTSLPEIPTLVGEITTIIVDIETGRWAAAPEAIVALILEFAKIAGKFGLDMSALTAFVNKLPFQAAVPKAA